MTKLFEDIDKLDTSSMTTEELKEFIDNLQHIVDILTHKFRKRKICEHK